MFDIRKMNDTASRVCKPRAAGAIDGVRIEPLQLLAARTVVGAKAKEAVVADQVDRNILAREQPLAAGEDRFEHGRRVGDRIADRGQDLTRRPLLIECFLRLVEQAHVLERDRRLVAESAQECDLPLGERPHFLPAQQDHAERMPLAIERSRDHRAMTEALCDFVAGRELAAVREHVAHLDCLSVEERAAGNRITPDRKTFDVRHRVRIRSPRGQVAKHIALGQVHRSG